MLMKKRPVACFVIILLILEGLWMCDIVHAHQLYVNKIDKSSVSLDEAGRIVTTRINHGTNASYLLQTFILYPNTTFLPVMLDSTMLLYVPSGRGRLRWTGLSSSRYTDLEEGDFFRVLSSVVFSIHSTPVQPLQINALFANSDYDLRAPQLEPYKSIQDMVLGFDSKELQTTFKVPMEVIEQVVGGKKPPAIIRVDDQITKDSVEEENILQYDIEKVNILNEPKDVENPYGWFTTLTKEKGGALNESGISISMVKLTGGTMMEPNWNLMAEEVVVVVEGRGMVKVVCSELSHRKFCRNKTFAVSEGAEFVVPRLHAKALMAFDDGPLVVMGFRVSPRKEPQFLGGKDSVLQALENDVVAMTFNVSSTTVQKLLASKDESIIFACTSCAEQELQDMEKNKE